MAITFPTLAVDGQLWEMGGITYRYSATGDKWVALSSITTGGSGSVPVSDIYFGLVQFDANTGDLIVGRNDMFFANTSIDGRYLPLSGGQLTGPLLLANTSTGANNEAISRAEMLTFVANVVATANDVYTVSAALDANGSLVYTLTDGSTYSVDIMTDLDARFVNVDGDIMTGPLVLQSDLTVAGNTNVSNFTSSGTSVFDGDVYTNQNLYSNNITVTGDTTLTDLTVTGNTSVTNITASGETVVNNLTATGNTSVTNFVANGTSVFEGDVYTQQTLYSNNMVVAGNTVVNNFYANGNTTFAGNTVFNQPVIFNSNTVFNGTLTAQTVSIAMGDLVDANTTGISNGQYLAWTGTEFTPVSLPATAGIDTKISGLAFDANTRVLTASVSDGSTLTTTIPGGIDTNDFVNNVAFDPITRLLTIGRTDGQVYTATIPDADEFVNVVTFNNTTRELTITRSDGNTFVSVIPETNLNGTVTNVTYDDASRTLGVQKADGSSIAYLVSEQDGQTISLTGNTIAITNGNSIDLTPILNVPHSIEDHTNVVISSATPGQVLTWDGLQWINTSLPPGTVDTFTNAGTLDSNTGIITFTRSDGNQFNVDISAQKPSLTLGELADVTITSPQNVVQTLKYFNGTWMNMNDGVNVATNNSTVDMGLAFVAPGSTHTGSILYNNKLLFNPTSGQLTVDGETITAAKIQAWDAASNTTFTETLTSLNAAGNILTYTDESGAQTNIDLSLYLDDTNLARLVSGTVAANGIATFTRDDSTTFDVDFSGIASGSLNDLSDVVAANPAADQVLTWDATNSIWTAKSPADVTKVRNYVDNNNLWQHMLFVWNTNSIEPLRTDGSNDFVYNPQKGQLRIAGNIVIDQGDSINELADVDTTTTLPANGDVLSWDSVNSVWSPAPAATTITNVGNTSPTSPADGDLWYDTDQLRTFVWVASSGTWVDAAPSKNETLTALSYTAANNTLSYADEAGNTTNIALSSSGITQPDARLFQYGDIPSGSGVTFGFDVGDNWRVVSANMLGNATIGAYSATITNEYEYTITIHLSNSGGGTITWNFPNITWRDGVTPAAPSTGATKVYVFSTIDGGTSWKGFEVGEFV